MFTLTEERYDRKRSVFKKLKPFNGVDAAAQNTYFFCSIIVPTYNRSKCLINALSHLIKQTVPKDNYEIIVVDDGSTDDTESQIAKYKIQNTRLRRGFGGQAKPEIRYFKIENGGPAKARNFGIKEARGEIIFFTDDDCIVLPDWMETLLDGHNRYPGVAGVGGWQIPPKEKLERNVVAKFIYYVSFFYDSRISPFLLSHEIISNDPMVCFETFAYNTANMSYRRDILEKMGGFREEFRWPGYEDNDLALRILHGNNKILYLPTHVIHLSHLKLSSLAKLYFRRGANYWLFMKLNKDVLEKIRPNLSLRNPYTFSVLKRHLLHRPYKFMTLIRFFSFNLGKMFTKYDILKS